MANQSGINLAIFTTLYHVNKWWRVRVGFQFQGHFGQSLLVFQLFYQGLTCLYPQVEEAHQHFDAIFLAKEHAKLLESLFLNTYIF